MPYGTIVRTVRYGGQPMAQSKLSAVPAPYGTIVRTVRYGAAAVRPRFFLPGTAPPRNIFGPRRKTYMSSELRRGAKGGQLRAAERPLTADADGRLYYDLLGKCADTSYTALVWCASQSLRWYSRLLWITSSALERYSKGLLASTSLRAGRGKSYENRIQRDGSCGWQCAGR